MISRHPDFVLVVLLCLSASWPFWARTSLPRETDLELHVFRAAEWAYAVQEGNPYPRWAAGFYYGYGYPIFNYYAPLTYILANIFAIANPTWVVFGIKAVIVSTFVAAGIGAWGAAKLISDARGGIIAAASYLFAPYVYLIDPHLRGAIAEFVALGAAPLALWCSMSFSRQLSSFRFIAATLTLASVILSHNLLGLVFFVLLVTWQVWQWLIEKPQHLLNVAKQTAPYLLAVLLTAFFWLPVALEQNAVQLSNLIGPGNFDFRNHFISFTELFGASKPLDLGAANPAFRFNLGMAQVLLALLGILGAALANQRQRIGWATFWGGASLIVVLLMMPVSLPLWEAIPAAAFVQFPWRLLGPAALTLALMAGFSTNLFADLSARWQAVGTAVAILAPVIMILPIFIPPEWDNFGPTDRAAILNFELGGTALGTTSTGDYLPIEVDAVPGPHPPIIEALSEQSTVDRVIRDELPSSAAVRLISSSGTRYIYQIETEEPLNLTFRTFLFDGWTAEIDDSSVEITAEKPSGFMTVRVPVEADTLTIFLRSTPARQIGVIVSLIGLSLLVVGGFFFRRQASEEQNQERPPKIEMRWAPVSQIVGLGLAFASITATLGLFQPRSTGVIAEPALNNTRQYLQGGIDLIGFDLPAKEALPGETYPITLYWKAREPVPDNYQVFVHLDTDPFHTWAQSDKLNPGDYPTTRWPMDQYVRDQHELHIPPGTPPGVYDVRVGLWNFMTGVRQLALSEDAVVLGDTLIIGTVEVRESNEPPNELPTGQEPITVTDELTLLGSSRTPAGIIDQADGLLVTTLYWQAVSPVSEDYTVAIQVRSEETADVIYEINQPPAGNLLAFSEWQQGNMYRDIHALRFDTAWAPGSYVLEVQLQDEAENAASEWVTLEKIERAAVIE